MNPKLKNLTAVLRICAKHQTFLVTLSLWVLGLGGGWIDNEVMAQSAMVRLAVVRTPDDSGLLRYILPDFEKQTGYRVQVQAAMQDVYDIARQGGADLVIAHYGFEEVERFVMQAYGLWPRPVFANQSGLFGPASDPAHIRDLSDAVEAFRRIAQTQTPFIVINEPVVKTLLEVLWEGAGRPERGDWYIDQGLVGREAIETAVNLGAYTLWGVDPFLRLQSMGHYDIQALLLNDSTLQRMMAAVVVNPKQVPGVNVEGAQALQRYLIAPATQAKIRTFRYPELDATVWWPAGQNN